MGSDKTVYIVHAIDTEGPLYESLNAKFERLKDTFNIEIEPSNSNLIKLQKGEFNLNGKESAVKDFLAPKLLKYNDSWEKIDSMLGNIMSPNYRRRFVDSYDNGWIYNWFCLDHVGYDSNPRRREIGFHNILDRYVEFIDKYKANMDGIHWHFHPMSTYKEAHRCATSYENSPHLHETLCRMIIDRGIFPSTFRAGFQSERPDSNWFLEQWIPFDCTNMSIQNPEDFELFSDFKKGRSGDWRRAPSDWSVYNPDIYDYQKVGSCNRHIGRFLNISTRIANITQGEVDKAFDRANSGKPTLLGIASHDFRDMELEVDLVRELIDTASKRYPEVKFKFCEAKDAFNNVVHQGDTGNGLNLKVDFYKEDGNYVIDVTTENGKVFGPQPYLAIKTKSGNFIHDNFDFGLDGKSWHYIFHFDSVLSTDVDKIGVASNDKYGNTYIKQINV
jgi:hypothetical protein